MVEGHSVHRVAAAHRQKLVGKVFRASSPNGRFADGARAIDGKKYHRIEAVGKNLFAFFGEDAGNFIVLHVHFGMSGQWSIFDQNKEDVPPVTSTTRLCLVHESGLVSHLSAMTLRCEDESYYHEKRKSLGQDPLRDDADPKELFSKVSSKRAAGRSIGEIIMDQSFFAGPGNIYRAEILFRAGVHPNTLCGDLEEEAFSRIWAETVSLLRRGFLTGSILTVDPKEAQALGRPSMRRYIYNAKDCGRCGTRVVSWDMKGRTCYACPTCQPAPAHSQDVKFAPARVFLSHCARESLEERESQGLEKLTVSELRNRLTQLGLSTSGKKSELIARIEGSGLRIKEEEGEKEVVGKGEEEEPVSALEAAREKLRAGESRAVEHVADVHPSQVAGLRGPRAEEARVEREEEEEDLGA
ncbi:hypothetical protein GUITHDRAFT_157061 [Guillardia theta CCMP2712]|uniref:DNA-(apurinic or apyrimidinic site) lyase n=1 Tax=Guillardia theta (strain CCMP2712) TaxID=905079 RepID=L1JW48_GUITC|nr:hypothetical protein GUITHDRAFT_157061 [Guillardia theta CCMP2712]EKX52430.1 hypothetical protein GUITHDRAFT_157061 [Guillardia theta CCMP2712]|eukprot:XP_005839410.1 hypothetical protein GUITHDRAFT_157061 [Guillardia theta CCMP2712]